MSWANKGSDGGNNIPVADPTTESRHKEYKHGYFYDGNMTTNAHNRMLKEGSKGLARNQGMIRTSAIVTEPTSGTVGQELGRIKKATQGSAAHLKA